MEKQKKSKKIEEKAQNEQKNESIQAEESSSEKQGKSKKSFKAIAKRYWYWPATVVIMGLIAVLWCYFMGYIGNRYKEKEAEIILEETEADLFLGMYYKIGAHAEGFAITYSIGEGTAEVEIDSFGVVHALKPGVKKIYVHAGNVQKSVRINVSEIRVIWQIGVGDKLFRSDIVEAFSSVYDMTKTFGIDVNALSALEPLEEQGYLAVEEGVEFFDITIEEEHIGTFQVIVKDGLSEEEKVTPRDLVIRPEGLDYETNIRETREGCIIGETGLIEDFSFSKGGEIRFYSSEPDSIKVYQDGTYKIYRPGTATIAVVCRTANGYEYYNIRFRTPVSITNVYRLNDEEESRNIYVGEVLSVSDDLYSYFWVDGLERTSAEEYGSYFEYDENNDTYRVLRSSNGDAVYIDGFDRDGKLLVRYAITIEEAE